MRWGYVKLCGKKKCLYRYILMIYECASYEVYVYVSPLKFIADSRPTYSVVISVEWLGWSEINETMLHNRLSKYFINLLPQRTREKIIVPIADYVLPRNFNGGWIWIGVFVHSQEVTTGGTIRRRVGVVT